MRASLIAAVKDTPGNLRLEEWDGDRDVLGMS